MHHDASIPPSPALTGGAMIDCNIGCGSAENGSEPTANAPLRWSGAAHIRLASRLWCGAHIYVSLSARTSVASLVDALKANSSRWIHETFPHLSLFSWQKGYSAFSVCRRCEANVISYIRNQDAHHGPARQGGADRKH